MEDNYSMFRHREREESRWLANRPVCVYCGEHIQDEKAYRINGELMCQECLENRFQIDVEDYI